MKYPGLAILSFLSLHSVGQSVMTPLSRSVFHMVDRAEIERGKVSNTLFTAMKPYLRSELLNILSDTLEASSVDRQNRLFMYRDNPDLSDSSFRHPSHISKRPYPYKAAAYHVRTPDFSLLLNPVLGLNYGRDGGELWQNTRAIEVRGSLSNKVGFYSFASENQLQLPAYQRLMIDSSGTLPGAGLYKTYKKNAYDFLTASGYLIFKPISVSTVSFGHDRQFIGNGFRSMIWSDHSRENLFLKIQTKVWRLQYTNLYTELSDLDRISGTGGNIRPKYAALHHLSFNAGKHINIGITEVVIFKNRNRGFEWQYLNPLILYRSAEHNLNSSHNVLAAADIKIIPFRNFCFYGQFILDEFKSSELKSGNKWWGNKYGLQAGLKWLNVLKIKQLDIQLEYNMARPYTYTHFDRSQNYLHYNQPLAHPLGANFKESIVILRYQPIFKLNMQYLGIYYLKGHDQDSFNYGGNILVNYENRPKEYGHITGQGITEIAYYQEFMLSYQWFHNMFLDFRISQTMLLSNSEYLDGLRNKGVNMIQLGLRIHLAERSPYQLSY